MTPDSARRGPPRNVAAVREYAGSSTRRREELYGLLGDLPSRDREIGGTKREQDDRGGYVLETWDLDLNGTETVPAYLARPRNVAGSAPAVLFNHSHGGDYSVGKEEFLHGRDYLQPKPYAEELTELGCVALCIDHWVFGERSHVREDDVAKAMLWQGQTLWGAMVYDSLRALDFLRQQTGVDPQRLGSVGMSMGSTMAWWVAALDERVKVTVDICCLTDFDTFLAEGDLSLHGLYYYVPGLVKHFTTAQINALVAPRAHLAVAGRRDALTPQRGLDRIERELDEVYAQAGHPERWKLLRYDAGHQETPAARREVVAFLERFL